MAIILDEAGASLLDEAGVAILDEAPIVLTSPVRTGGKIRFVKKVSGKLR